VVILLFLTSIYDLRTQRDVIPGVDQLVIYFALALSVVLIFGVLYALWCVLTLKTEDGKGSVLASVCESSLLVTTMVFTIIIGAAMFSLVFRGFGGDLFVEHFLANLPGGTVGAILIVMATMFLMGFFLDFLEIVFIVVPIVAPILLQMEMEPGVGMNPVWLGVMMAVNLQTSFLTPPFGFALFYLRGVAPSSVRTMDIYRGIIPCLFRC
jgi:TRAP-type mannitol/chloroaromatic compound transport system permease large subunit